MYILKLFVIHLCVLRHQAASRFLHHPLSAVQTTEVKEDPGSEDKHAWSMDVKERPTLLEVIAVWPCARAIFVHVPVRDLVRSERVSTRWQHAVHDYLQSYHNLTFVFSDDIVNQTTLHRIIEIKSYVHEMYLKSSLSPCCNLKPVVENEILHSKTKNRSIAQNILVTMGTSIVKVVTDCCEDDFFENIASNCPRLRHLELNCRFGKHLPFIITKHCKNLKDVSFMKNHTTSDKELCKIFQYMNREKISIRLFYTTGVTGSFLKSVKSGRLQCLRLEACGNLNIHDLHSSVYNLRNIICLQLDNLPFTVFANIHLLLDEMPKLEELSLRDYHESGNLSKEVIKCFGRLNNLQRLDMSYNINVNVALLGELARGCPKLEYLNLYGTAIIDQDQAGLAALCRRTLSLVTLHVAYRPRRTSRYSVTFEWSPHVVEELDALGYVKLTPDYLERARDGWYPYELRARGAGRQDVNYNSELNVILVNVQAMN